ncbi:MAG: CopG family transcriptional regulator [Deltaproteobacteria bacterium]|nr:CopG family transcriptional regulator [Deltaproteobacteria bacterium]
MIRTQISLPEKEYLLVQKEAKREGISLAEFFRRALRSALPFSKGKRWMRYAGLIESGDPQSSQTIDDLIYGKKD